jgi:uncharacterized protein YbaP (TraB family)
MASILSNIGRATGAIFLLALAATPAIAAPAWWRLSDGHAEVWILGAPRITPKAAFWDTSTVERRLWGASQLIVASQPKGGIAAMASIMGSGASPTPMEAGLSPALRRRFDAVAASIGQDPKHYDHWKPGIAGQMLAGDVYKSAGLKAGEVEALVRKLARKAGVRETPASVFDVGVMARSVAGLSKAGHEACLSDTLHGLEIGTAKMKANAADWARGAYNASPVDAGAQACLSAMPAMQAQAEQQLTGQAAALASALKSGGRSVAVLDLQSLTMADGVFDRLRAKGLTVSGPVP